MNRKEYLLACLSEECGEVVQVIGKAQRFGVLDIFPRGGETNWLKLRNEVHDIIAVYEMYCEDHEQKLHIYRELILAKKLRVEHFMGYSKKEGLLDDSN